jgi:hypothetical protein
MQEARWEMGARPEHISICGGVNSRIIVASKQRENTNIFKTYCGKDQAMLSSDIFFEAFGEVLFILSRGRRRRIRQAGKSVA